MTSTGTSTGTGTPTAAPAPAATAAAMPTLGWTLIHPDTSETIVMMGVNSPDGALLIRQEKQAHQTKLVEGEWTVEATANVQGDAARLTDHYTAGGFSMVVRPFVFALPPHVVDALRARSAGAGLSAMHAISVAKAFNKGRMAARHGS